MQAMKNDTPKYLKLHRQIYKIYGISFDQNESVAYIIYSRIVLFFVLFAYPLIQISALIYYLRDWNRLSTLLTFTLMNIIGKYSKF